MSGPVYIFAGGGTGGHLVPALAVAEELAGLQPAATVVFACSDRDIDRRILSATGYPFVPQAVGPMPRGLRGWGQFLRSLGESRRQARDLLDDLCPRAVLGLGGFAAVPVVRAAARGGVRVGLMSIDAVPGVANRHLARHVQAIFTQYGQTQARYGRSAGKVRQVGCPIRRALLEANRAEARRIVGLRDDRKTLLVVSGSLGADNINQAVAALSDELDALADQWQVLHVAGPGKLASASAGRMHRVVLDFCDRMDLAYAAADLVLCRAGAATIGELVATARPAVLMPYPYHRDQHQRLNAAEMVSAGAAEVVPDACDAGANASALRPVLIDILRRADRLERMTACAARAARTNAAEAIARWLSG